MLLISTLILGFLLAVNFLLLAFSCNKTEQKAQRAQPKILPATRKSVPIQLAPTVN